MADVPDEVTFNGWIRLASDGTVRVVMSKAEMGQGVHTALLMIVAEEMNCPMSQVRQEPAPIDPLYGNVTAMAEGIPFRPDDQGVLATSARWVMNTAFRQIGILMTGGSSSIRDLWIPLRHAAAAAHASIVYAAADYWRVSEGDITVREGLIHGPNGKEMAMRELVSHLSPNPRVPAVVALKHPSAFTLIGQATRRIDSLDKISGRATFGIDVRPEGLLYAAVKMAPTLDGRVASCDATKAIGRAGVEKVVTVDPPPGGAGAVAVIAHSWFDARQALDDLDVEFDNGAHPTFSSAEAMVQLEAAASHDQGTVFWRRGDVAAHLNSSSKRVEAAYSAPYLSHATMEPINCTALLNGKRGTIWLPTQVPGFARKAAATAFGLEEESVDVHCTYLGGGFGRRLEVDFVSQAAMIARAVPGRPVQLIWTREDDTRHDFYRPAAFARMRADLDANGKLVAWKSVSSGQAIVKSYLARNAGLPFIGPDKTTVEGEFDSSYEFPNVQVSHVVVDLPIPVGFWRSVGHSYQAFFKECFIDECAAAAQADPLEFRAALLSAHPRQLAVLNLAANKAGWKGKKPYLVDGSLVAQGIALHESFGAIVAAVIEVSIASDKSIQVRRVVCAVDCGLPVNPDGIRQQIEGGVVFALSAALEGRIDVEANKVRQGNFHELLPLRFHQAPAVETFIVPSEDPPGGMGEPGVPPIAPALANAMFCLTGERLRALPLKLTT